MASGYTKIEPISPDLRPVMSERLKTFLGLAHEARWRPRNAVPAVWAEEYRDALSAGFIRIGWGGAVQLTDAGRDAALTG